jgi:hypothetical protein
MVANAAPTWQSGLRGGPVNDDRKRQDLSIPGSVRSRFRASCPERSSRRGERCTPTWASGPRSDGRSLQNPGRFRSRSRVRPNWHRDPRPPRSQARRASPGRSRRRSAACRSPALIATTSTGNAWRVSSDPLTSARCRPPSRTLWDEAAAPRDPL